MLTSLAAKHTVVKASAQVRALKQLGYGGCGPKQGPVRILNKPEDAKGVASLDQHRNEPVKFIGSLDAKLGKVQTSPARHQGLAANAGDLVHHEEGRREQHWQCRKAGQNGRPPRPGE